MTCSHLRAKRRGALVLVAMLCVVSACAKGSPFPTREATVATGDDAERLRDLVASLGAGRFEYDASDDPTMWISDEPRGAVESKSAFSKLLQSYPESGYWPVFVTEDPSGVSVDAAFSGLGVRQSATTWFQGVASLPDYFLERSRLGVFRVGTPIQVLALFGIQPSDLKRMDWVRSLTYFGSQEVGPALIWNSTVTFLLPDNRFIELSDERFEQLMKETNSADIDLNPFRKGSNKRSFSITW